VYLTASNFQPLWITEAPLSPAAEEFAPLSETNQLRLALEGNDMKPQLFHKTSVDAVGARELAPAACEPLGSNATPKDPEGCSRRT